MVIQGGGRIITARATLADCHIQINFYTRQPHHVPCNDRHLDAPAARKIMHTPSQTRCSSKRETSCNRRSLERNFRTACQIVLHTQEKRAKGKPDFLCPSFDNTSTAACYAVINWVDMGGCRISTQQHRMKKVWKHRQPARKNRSQINGWRAITRGPRKP